MEIPGWINLTILVSLVATALQVAGYVVPMWIWLDVEDFRVGVGLWFTIGCGLQGTCKTAPPTVAFGYTTDDTWTQPQFSAVRGLETLALAGSVLLLLFLVVYRAGWGQWADLGQLNLAAFLTSVLTWLCILAGLIVYCAYYWPVVGTSPMVTRTSFPWSLVLCLFAAFFFIVVSVLIRVKCRDRARLKNAVPISGDTHMETYPVTKHGLLHRYFLPFYRGLRGNNQAIEYQTEGKTVHTMNTRLVEAEEHTNVAAIDNAAFYENRVLGRNNVNYGHLPIESGQEAGPRVTGHDQAETMIRRSLPTAIITYTDGQTTADLHRLHTKGDAATTTTLLHSGDGQNYRDISAAANRDGMLHLRHHADDDDTRHAAGHGEGGAETRGYHQAGGVTPRDGIHQHGRGVTSRDGDAVFRAGAGDVTYQTGRAGDDVTYRTVGGGGGEGRGATGKDGHWETTGEAAGSRDARFQKGAAGTKDHRFQNGATETRNHRFQNGAEETRDHRFQNGAEETRNHRFQNGAAKTRDHRFQNGAAEGTRDHLLHPHTEGGGARTHAHHAGGEGRSDRLVAYLSSDAQGRDGLTEYQRGTGGGDVITTRDSAEFGQGGGGGGVRRDAFGNIITEERVVTTTTYTTEESYHKRGGLKVTELESNDGGYSSKHFSTTGRTRAGDGDGDSVKPYDDTYIYRPFAETE
ncbi:hypothetical protein ACOMHN_057921 [Nucella lapillus]